MSRIEEIRSAAQAHYPSGTNHEEIKVASFIRGARYADKTMIEKACEWLESVLKSDLGYYGAADFAGTFRKAMEE